MAMAVPKPVEGDRPKEAWDNGIGWFLASRVPTHYNHPNFPAEFFRGFRTLAGCRWVVVGFPGTVEQSGSSLGS